jgi:hypothetical protein
MSKRSGEDAIMPNFKEVLTLENYRKLLNSLKIVSSYIDDIDMKSGVIRQRTPDKATIISLDLSNLFKQDLSVASIKSKLPILELLLDDEEDEITIQAADNFWFVFNKKTVFKFTWSSDARLSTNYIDGESFKEKFECHMSDQSILHSIKITERPDVHKKIKKVCESYNSDKIVMTVNEKGKLGLSIDSLDKRNTSVIYSYDVSNSIKNEYTIIIRSNFIDKMDTKSVNELVFYDELTDKANVSIVKADCTIEEMTLNIYTYAQCKKK